MSNSWPTYDDPNNPAEVEAKFWALVTSAAGLSLAKRNAIWSEALTLMQGMIVKNYKSIKNRPDLYGKLQRFYKLAGVSKGDMGDTEREAVYLAALQAGEGVLVPFGFHAGMEKLRADMSATEVARRNVSQAEIADLSAILDRLAKMLPWKGVRVEIDSAIVADEDANTWWDGANRKLVFCLQHARMVRKNLTDLGVYSTLVGQIIAPMLTPPHAITDIVSALVLTAEIGKQLGAKDVNYAPAPERRNPPGIYRGAAAKVLQAVWNESRTLDELRDIAPGADLERMFQMFATDGQDYEWKVVSNGSLFTVIVA